MGAACGLPGVALVNARGADDCEPAQHVPRGGAEGGHREAAHDARLRAREPAFLAHLLLKPSLRWCWWAMLTETYFFRRPGPWQPCLIEWL